MSTPDRLINQFYLKDDLLQTKLAVLICCFFVSVLMYGDYLNFGLTSDFNAVILTRAVFLLFSAAMLIVLKNVKTVQQHECLIFVWAIFFILLAIYVNITRPVTNINFTYVDTLIVLAMFLVFPSNVYLTGVLAGILTVGDLMVIAFLKHPVDDLSFKTIGLSYILANVLGYFVASRLQKFRQKHYRAFLQEQSVRKELENVAFIDHLTGALIRRKFFQLGVVEFDRFRSLQTPFSIIMLDLDFFKNINDIFGHAAGDYYLKEFTKFIIENKRSRDIFGRLGGEEFALVLPETGLQAALEMAERLRQLCGEQCFYLNNQPLRTTVSIGVTNAEKNDQTFQDVLKRADEALYQAKREGRNKVCS